MLPALRTPCRKVAEDKRDKDTRQEEPQHPTKHPPKVNHTVLGKSANKALDLVTKRHVRPLNARASPKKKPQSAKPIIFSDEGIKETHSFNADAFVATTNIRESR